MKKYWFEISLGIIMFIYFPILTAFVFFIITGYYNKKIYKYIKYEVMLWDCLTYYLDSPFQRKFIMDAIDSGRKLNQEKLKFVLSIIKNNELPKPKLEFSSAHIEQLVKQRKQKFYKIGTISQTKRIKQENEQIDRIYSKISTAIESQCDYILFKTKNKNKKKLIEFCNKRNLNYVIKDEVFFRYGYFAMGISWSNEPFAHLNLYKQLELEY